MSDIDKLKLAVGVLKNAKVWLSCGDIYLSDNSPKLDESDANAWRVKTALKVIEKFLSDVDIEGSYDEFLKWNGGSH